MPFNSLAVPPLTNSASFYTDSIVTDTLNWIKITGSVIADSSYSYLMIGNFFDAANTDTIIFGGPSFGGSSSYYYIDDVCVTTDSIYNENWTNVSGVSSLPLLSVFPNPATTFVSVFSSDNIISLTIFDILGREVYSKNVNNNKSEIDIQNFNSGTYIIVTQFSGKDS
ncbi:MAG: T9SS type A sorting domain-containing protein [Bacteroidetes bacterium]|nr:T9SS type A sorting domain-containing protein [Bacteroidota bacterium]